MAVKREPDDPPDVAALHNVADRYWDIEPDFKFSGLRSLIFENIQGEIVLWRSQILRTMVDCPDLEQLSLSIAPEMIEEPMEVIHYRDGDEDEDEEVQMCLGLFRWICTQYMERVGAPLKLKELRLGNGIIFRDLAYLDRAFDSSALEKVHIHNEEVSTVSITYPIPWGLLEPSNSPKLRFISLSHLTSDCVELAAGAAGVDAAVVHAAAGLRIGSGVSCDNFFDLYDLFSRDTQGISRPRMLILSHTPADNTLEPLKDNDWITAIKFFGDVYSEHGTSPITTMEENIETLATFRQLKYLWIRVKNPHHFNTGFLAKRLSRSCPRLVYLRINEEAWAVDRCEGEIDGTLQKESADKWMDDSEEMEFLRWGTEMDLMD